MQLMIKTIWTSDQTDSKNKEIYGHLRALKELQLTNNINLKTNQ